MLLIKIKIIAFLLIGIVFLIAGIIVFRISKHESIVSIMMGSIFIITSKILYNKWIKKK